MQPEKVQEVLLDFDELVLQQGPCDDRYLQVRNILEIILEGLPE